MKKKVYKSRLRELAEKHPKVSKMSQGEIAKAVGVTRQTINRWYDPNDYFDEPPYSTAKRIAKLLGLKTTDELFYLVEIEQPNNNADSQRRPAGRETAGVFSGLH